MRVSLFLEDVLDRAQFAAIHRLMECDEEIFSELTKLFGLNPRSDFRFADLVGVDFSRSDLRGYDFTGSDLRGSIGIGAIWDDTTILLDADVGNSCFSYEVRKRSLLQDEIWKHEYDRRTKDFWTKNIQWFAKRLVGKGSGRSVAVELAKAVCDGTNDAFLRSQLLLFMAPVFNKAIEHRDYLIHYLSKHPDDQNLRVVIQTLSALYGDDEFVFDILSRYLGHRSESVRDSAMRAILRSKMLRNNLADISRVIPTFGISSRHLYLLRVGSIYKIPSKFLTNSLGVPYDMAETIAKSDIERAAFFQIRMEDMQKVQNRKFARAQIQISDPTRDRVIERMSAIQAQLERMADLGIPLRLGWLGSGNATSSQARNADWAP